MTDETIENKENLETETPESEASDSASEVVESAETTAEETTESTTESTEASGEESKEEEKVAAKSYSQEEFDAATAGARKQGMSRGKKDMMEQFEGIIPEQIFDPSTGQPMDPANPLYTSVRQKFAEDATLKYNKQVQLQQMQQQAVLQQQQQQNVEAKEGYESQIKELSTAHPELAKIFNESVSTEWSKTQCDAMLYVATTTQNGIATLASLVKSNPAAAEKLSNLPPFKQAAEMTRLIDLKNKGKGAAIKKSNAPKPASSFASGGSSSGRKSPENMSYEDIYKETRAKLGMT